MKTVALFDFCETIVKTQTVGQFCRYYLKNGLSFSSRKVFLYRLVNLLRISLKKEPIWFDFFNGLHVDELNKHAEEYANHLYQTFLIQEIEEKIKWHIAQGHLIIIVSAGLSCYIQFLAQKLGVQHVIAVDFEHSNQLLTGQINKQSYCYGVKKIDRLYAYLNLLNENKNNIDWINSYAYSDHPSDIPLLNLVGNRFVVTKNGSQTPFSKEYLAKKEVNIIQY